MNASEPEDTRSVIYNFLENELRIENPRARYELQRVHRLGKPKSTSPRPIIVRFLRFTDKEEVMSAARQRLKDKDFFIYDDIPKELYDQRKQQQKKFKQALDKGYRVYFSKAHPDQLFVNQWNEHISFKDEYFSTDNSVFCIVLLSFFFLLHYNSKSNLKLCKSWWYYVNFFFFVCDNMLGLLEQHHS